MAVFIAIVIAVIVFSLMSHLLTQFADENLGCLGKLIVVVFLQFGLPILIVGTVLAIVIINHDSQIP